LDEFFTTMDIYAKNNSGEEIVKELSADDW
jgi:hypothetical protein